MTDYLGRTTSIEFQAINNEMAESTHKSGLNGEYDPLKITYFAHPNREDKLYVTQKPELIRCRMCNEKHTTYMFTLEKDYKVMYCDNYKGGNWIFMK
tara:strand:- start:111 stop:401 length:291 start_codon:yes stop_codon:yes gene_type:complete